MCETMPQMMKLLSLRTLMTGYLRLAGTNEMPSLLMIMRLTVKSPSIKQTAISPSCGSIERSMMSMSPSFIPESTIESPITFAQKVAAGLLMSSWLRSTESANAPWAGLGNPACMRFSNNCSSMSLLSSIFLNSSVAIKCKGRKKRLYIQHYWDRKNELSIEMTTRFLDNVFSYLQQVYRAFQEVVKCFTLEQSVAQQCDVD